MNSNVKITNPKVKQKLKRKKKTNIQIHVQKKVL